MTKFIKSYKSLVADLDHAFKDDGNLGYKFLVGHTLLILGMCVQSVVLDLRVVG